VACSCSDGNVGTRSSCNSTPCTCNNTVTHSGSMGGSGGASGGSVSSTTGGYVSGGSSSSSGGSVAMGGAGGTCERPAPSHPDPCFVPCAGDPVGMWDLQDTCVHDAYPANPGSICEYNSTGSFKEGDLRLNFVNGGDFHAYGNETWELTMRETTCDQCQQDSDYLLTDSGRVGGQLSSDIEMRDACGPSCKKTLSGDFPADDKLGSFSFTWSSLNNQLKIQYVFDGGFYSYDYCVNGNELWIGAGPVAYRFARVGCFGKPTPCTQRTTAECTLGGECTLGTCVGADPASQALCDGLDQMGCGAVSGCSWDASACTGVSRRCELGSCDAEPGCQLVTQPHTCVGTPTPCSNRSADCGFGCGMGLCGSADAMETRSCNLALGAGCPYAKGCVDTPNACLGMTSCLDQWTEPSCNGINCDWTPSASCTGQPIACENLALDDCALQPGCSLSP
jgi:hypothetical protein